jgi:hypothetical protein
MTTSEQALRRALRTIERIGKEPCELSNDALEKVARMRIVATRALGDADALAKRAGEQR